MRALILEEAALEPPGEGQVKLELSWSWLGRKGRRMEQHEQMSRGCKLPREVPRASCCGRARSGHQQFWPGGGAIAFGLRLPAWPLVRAVGDLWQSVWACVFW